MENAPNVTELGEAQNNYDNKLQILLEKVNELQSIVERLGASPPEQPEDDGVKTKTDNTVVGKFVNANSKLQDRVDDLGDLITWLQKIV